MTWDVQKGAQLKDTSGRGCAWYADQNGYHVRYRCGLHAGLQPHRGIRCWLYFSDRGYDSNSFIEYIEEHSMEAVILPHENRKIQKNIIYIATGI